MTKRSKIGVEVWSDIICPMCWIGLVRFERALAILDEEDYVDIVHRAFRLAQGQSPQPVEAMIMRKFGIPESAVPDMLRKTEEMAAQVRLNYRLAGTSVGDTLAAHRIVKLAEAKGKGRDVLIRLFKGYFSEHASIFDHDSLLALAHEAGLEYDEASLVLQTDVFHEDVTADQERLQTMGFSGVPFFLIDGKYAVSGAQTTAAFADALKRARADRCAAPALVVAPDGEICGPDGCALPDRAA